MVAIKRKKVNAFIGSRAILFLLLVAMFVTGVMLWAGTETLESSSLDETWAAIMAKTGSNSDYSPKVVFNPETVLNGNLKDYVSLPVLDDNVTYADIQARVKRAIARPVDTPPGLLHQGHPPGHDVVMGLASWPKAMNVFRILVGSLRQTGYDGHIILGVHPDIPKEEQDYLKKMDVTFYATELAECSHKKGLTQGKMEIREKCAKGTEQLTLEKGRFEMARQWLHACKECTGWALVMDTRDAFFQASPFSTLPPPDESPYDLLFIEELAPYSKPETKKSFRITTVDNGFYQGSDSGCYGHHYHKKYPGRAILCSGTIIGNRKGIDRFLAVFVDEFLENNRKENKHCTGGTPDQLVLQPLYYSGYFGDIDRTRTSPWGTGPVNTIGVPCARENKVVVGTNLKESPLELTNFDKETGLILNPITQSIVPVVHQFDRCWNWCPRNFFVQHDKDLFGDRKTPVEKVKAVPWLKDDNESTQ